MSAAVSNAQSGRSSDRRSLIRDNAAALFATRGIARTSVREIADSVGILSGSLYHHFPSKDAMVDEIVTTYLEQLLARFRSASEDHWDPRAALERLIHVLLDVIRDHPNATLIYQNDADYLRGLPSAAMIDEVTAEIQRIWMGIIERGVADGVFRESLNPGVVYRLMRDAIWLTLRWFDPAGPVSQQELAEQCIQVFLDGIAVSPGRS